MNTKNELGTMVRNYRFLKATTAVVAMLAAVSHARAGETTAGRKGGPLKVVILAGQSNMQEPAKWHTLKGLADSPETKPLYDMLVDENGKVRIHKDVHIAMPQYGQDEEGNKTTTPVPGPLPHGFGGLVLGQDKAGGSYGPELGFGVTLYETLQEPILIIKAAWGGKDLHSQFRPPIGEEWTPPKGHPDHPESAPPALPIPSRIELPDDFKPPEGRGKHMQIGRGFSIGEVNGVHPIYLSQVYEKKGNLTSIPFEKGDLIIGLNGQGLRENPIRRWRDLWFNEVRDGDWTLKITRWRNGKIETVEIDTAQTLDGGRASVPAYLAAKKAARKKLLAEGGEYYGKMNKIPPAT